MGKLQNIIVIKLAFLIVVFCNVIVDVSHKILLQNIAFKIFDGSEQVIWVSLINALIIIPFLLLFSLSGHLSDKYNKKDILVYGALSSFILSLLMILAYLSGNFYFAMFSLMLLAAQSAIYSPAKFGIIMDIYGRKNLAKGNASLQAVSIIGILFAIGSGSYIFESFYIENNLSLLSSKESLLDAVLPLTFFIAPIAFLEMLISFLILKRLKTSYTKTKKKILDKDKLFKGKILFENLKALKSNDMIFLSVIGLSVFWGISQGMLAVFPSYAKQYLYIDNVFIINGILATSGLGIALGSIFYSKISKNYIEIGTVPLASLGLACVLYLTTLVHTPIFLAFAFFLFGFFGGLFIVPLNALIQFNARKKNLGTILAGNNWFNSLSMFIMLCITTIVSFNDLDPLKTLYLILIITVFGTLYTIYKLPQSLLLLFVKFIIGLRYKLEVDGIKNIPSSGGVLLLGNHVSWIDWAVILMSSPREVKFVIYKPIYDKWYLTWILKIFKTIPISNSASKFAMQNIAKELDEGHMVVLFPEGGITRNGHLGEFKKGFEKILEFTQTDVKVISFYIRGLWESMFSRASKKYKESYRNRCVTVSFSQVMKKENANIISIKNEIIELSTKAWKEHISNLDILSTTILDKLKELGNKKLFSDTTGLELSGYKFLTVSILFKTLLKKYTKGENIGLLIPSTCAGAFLNFAVLMLGKRVVNLNYTSELDLLKQAVEKADIKSLVVSRKFIEKLEQKGIYIKELFEIVDVIYVEDLKSEISKIKGLSILLLVKILPNFLLKAIFIKRVKKDDTVAILFSSGSESAPKGVELTSDNILGNTQQIAALLNVNDEDIIVGSLPIFHAFGITVTTFLPLVEGIRCIAHPDPTDGASIGKLVYENKATIMFGTSTFFRLYTKNSKVNSLMFQSLRFTVAGAEKLRDDVRIEFKKKFDKEILEGFGTTETTPVASCNLPNEISPDFFMQVGEKKGTVGLPIPGTLVKIVDPETFKELEVEEEGMVLISGIQVMKGYLKDEAKTNEVLKKIDGHTFYITGDKGKVDKDGFLTIIDRYSRFAKLAGEMISLGAIEQKLASLIGLDDESKDYIITSLEDEKKGEKIILLISGVDEVFVQKLKEEIKKTFDNKLMIPSYIKIVEDIPKLGSGKKDFKKAKSLALNAD